LAIELAASRMASMTAIEVRDRLDHRFRLLVGSRRGLERHHTLRHAVAWSHDHLDDAEKTLLERCSAFSGGFDLQSACAVSESDDPDDYAILDLLDALVRKSLIVADRSTGRTRYSMLETIREFAEEQLVAHGAAATVRAAHAQYFAGREADLLALWDSRRQREAYDWFTVELANLRTAFRWAADHDDLDTAATIATLGAFLGFGIANYEPIAWAEELIEPASAIDHPRLATLYVIASLCWMAGRVEAAVHYADDGQMVIGSGRHEVPFETEGMLGNAYIAAGQPERTVEWCRAQLARGRDTHTFTRTSIVFALAYTGSGEEARAATTGLIDAAEAPQPPGARIRPFRRRVRVPRRRPPPRAGSPPPGTGDRSRQRQPHHRDPAGGRPVLVRGHVRRPNDCVRLRQGGHPQLPRVRQHLHDRHTPGGARRPLRPARTPRTSSDHRRFRVQSPHRGGDPGNQHRGRSPPPCPRRPDLRIARPRGPNDDHRRHGSVCIRPNRPGPNRTERRLEIDP
jgi:hypothetical protein